MNPALSDAEIRGGKYHNYSYSTAVSIAGDEQST